MDLPDIYTLKYYKSKITAIKNSMELYLNEDNKYYEYFRIAMKNESDLLGESVNKAIIYRLNNPIKEEDFIRRRLIKSPLVRTDGGGSDNYLDNANNKYLIEIYIKYSKEERNRLPRRVKDYIEEFKKKSVKK